MAILAKTLELVWQVVMVVLMISSSLVYHRHIDDKKSLTVLVVGVTVDTLYIAHNQLLTNCRFHCRTRCFTIGECLYKLFDVVTCRFKWVQENMCQRGMSRAHVLYELCFMIVM